MKQNIGRILRFYTTKVNAIQPTGNTFRLFSRGAQYAIGIASLGFGACVLFDTRSAVYPHVVMPLIRWTFDGETAHLLSIWLAKAGLAPSEGKSVDGLETEVLGLPLESPVGLAAGYDKHAEAIDSLLGFGFSMVEIGSVTPEPQDGNAKPRVFRLLEDVSVINRYGFNSHGHQSVANRLSDRERTWLYNNNHRSLPDDLPHSFVRNKALGINLGKNKNSAPDDNSDYVRGVEKFAKYADYLVVNVSSPNTPGLRSLQRREPMFALLQEVKEARDKASTPRKPPLLVKIAPDVSDLELEDIAAVVQSVGIDGVIISNTTITRPSSLKSEYKNEIGGLSGPPVFPLALEKVRKFYSLTKGNVPIIGCGGISSGKEALAFAKAGASAVQLYTSLIYKGPGVVHEVKQELLELLKKENRTWKEVVGLDHHQN